MTPDDLIDLAVYNGLHFEASSQAGVVFHLMGALSRYGKLGLVAIGEDLVTAGPDLPGDPGGSRQGGGHRHHRQVATRLEAQCRIAADLGRQMFGRDGNRQGGRTRRTASIASIVIGACGLVVLQPGSWGVRLSTSNRSRCPMTHHAWRVTRSTARSAPIARQPSSRPTPWRRRGGMGLRPARPGRIRWRGGNERRLPPDVAVHPGIWHRRNGNPGGVLFVLIGIGIRDVAERLPDVDRPVTT